MVINGGHRHATPQSLRGILELMNKSPDFPDTRWSVVARAAAEDSVQKEQALAELYRLYFYPLYAFARQRGLDQHAAEDDTQDFMLKLMAGGWEKADPLRGRLRAFLMTAFAHFIADRIRGQRTQKRGGGVEHVSLDFGWAEERYGAEPSDGRTLEVAFDRRWALVAYEAALGELQALREASGKGAEFAELRQFLSPHIPKTETYPQVAARLGVSADVVATQVHRLRGKFRDLMRRHIADTLTQPREQDIMQEWSALLEALLRPVGDL